MDASDRRTRFGRARVAPLGEEPDDGLVERTTPEERVAMVWPLTLEAWRLAGREIPDYARHELTVRIVPLGEVGAGGSEP